MQSRARIPAGVVRATSLTSSIGHLRYMSLRSKTSDLDPNISRPNFATSKLNFRPGRKLPSLVLSTTKTKNGSMLAFGCLLPGPGASLPGKLGLAQRIIICPFCPWLCPTLACSKSASIARVQNMCLGRLPHWQLDSFLQRNRLTHQA